MTKLMQPILVTLLKLSILSLPLISSLTVPPITVLCIIFLACSRLFKSPLIIKFKFHYHIATHFCDNHDLSVKCRKSPLIKRKRLTLCSLLIPKAFSSSISASIITKDSKICQCNTNTPLLTSSAFH